MDSAIAGGLCARAGELAGVRTRWRQNSLASELAFFSLATQTSERLMNLSDFSRLLSATITRANLAIWEFSIAARTVLRKENIVLGITTRLALSAMLVVSLLPYGILPLPLSYWKQKCSLPSTYS
jgi:hypothetical protein